MNIHLFSDAKPHQPRNGAKTVRRQVLRPAVLTTAPRRTAIAGQTVMTAIVTIQGHLYLC